MSDQKTAVVEIKHIATFGWFFIIFSMLLSVLFISV